eukprot:TRINITY_DN15983_c0_g1_i1.p1 TRINITY_DN15983_c0_g1~~TRINITY_DN15983_c0_g1_i1.p1  ORF type:complete len:226 (+),score=72.78 TRINITY_DN15983_c0_g1_i1:59-736(+)
MPGKRKRDAAAGSGDPVAKRAKEGGPTPEARRALLSQLTVAQLQKLFKAAGVVYNAKSTKPVKVGVLADAPWDAVVRHLPPKLRAKAGAAVAETHEPTTKVNAPTTPETDTRGGVAETQKENKEASETREDDEREDDEVTDHLAIFAGGEDDAKEEEEDAGFASPDEAADRDEEENLERIRASYEKMFVTMEAENKRQSEQFRDDFKGLWSDIERSRQHLKRYSQ